MSCSVPSVRLATNTRPVAESTATDLGCVPVGTGLPRGIRLPRQVKGDHLVAGDAQVP
jgi:hypothetical protein